MSTLQGNKQVAEHEASIQRNPHGDFKSVEASRQPYQRRVWTQVQTPQPDWTAGSGANQLDPEWKKKEIIDIDPYEPGRPAVKNYKLLISAIVPRPIGFVSTISQDGKTNLAPFSYTQFVNHDPPIFVIGFAGSIESAKDSLRNVLDTKELVINMISEHFIEAANYTSINAPKEVSEWDLSGLTPLASVKVQPARVHESIFTAECNLVDYKEWKRTRRKDDWCNDLCRSSLISCSSRMQSMRTRLCWILLSWRPVSRLGGITYSTIDNRIRICHDQTLTRKLRKRKSARFCIRSSCCLRRCQLRIHENRGICTIWWL